MAPNFHSSLYPNPLLYIWLASLPIMKWGLFLQPLIQADPMACSGQKNAADVSSGPRSLNNSICFLGKLPPPWYQTQTTWKSWISPFVSTEAQDRREHPTESRKEDHQTSRWTQANHRATASPVRSVARPRLIEKRKKDCYFKPLKWWDGLLHSSN